MMGAQGLKSLQLELPFSRRSSPDLMTEAQYPEIAYLEVDTTRVSPHALLSISTALKPSLKFLSLRGCYLNHVGKLFPVYETLRENLEGLSVHYIYSLESTGHISFPKLRILAVDDLSDFGLLSQAMFSKSPIELLAIGHHSTSRGTITLDTFLTLPNLKKSILCGGVYC
jgi:hypothetical protein